MVKDNREFSLYSTRGSSMFPFIRGDEYVFVKKVPPETIRPGDTIVFEFNAKTKVCHCVVEIQRRDSILWFYTAGYKNRSPDTCPIRQEKVMGKVFAIKRKSNIIRLSTEGLQSLLFKFDCFLTESIFYIKKFLAKIPLLKKIYKYTSQKLNFFLR